MIIQLIKLKTNLDEEELLKRTRHALEHEAGIRNELVDREQIIKRIASLTTRERQIFDRVAEGKAKKEIGYDLGISERTVEVHRSQVMKKLEVRALAQLVRIKIEAERLIS